MPVLYCVSANKSLLATDEYYLPSSKYCLSVSKYCLSASKYFLSTGKSCLPARKDYLAVGKHCLAVGKYCLPVNKYYLTYGQGLLAEKSGPAPELAAFCDRPCERAEPSRGAEILRRPALLVCRRENVREQPGHRAGHAIELGAGLGRVIDDLPGRPDRLRGSDHRVDVRRRSLDA